MFARRRVLGRLAIILLGIAVLAASPGRGHAAGTEDAGAFLASLTDRAFAQLSDESLAVDRLGDELAKQGIKTLFQSRLRPPFQVPVTRRTLP
jgi:hypothetical protein